MPSTRITELAGIIASKTALVNDYFEFHGIPTPTFDKDGPSKILIPLQVKEIALAHHDVLEATKELTQLLQGPRAMIMENTPNDLLSLHAIYHYNIPECVPIDGEISFDELSEKCGLNAIDLRRILRYSMLNHIFEEPRKGYVAHTAASRLLAEDKALSAWVGLRCEEHFQAASRTVDALVKYGHSQDPAQSGFALGHNTDNGFFDEIQKYPERLRRFGNAMQASAARRSASPLFDAFDWASLGKATVVDVGGSQGAVAIGLAQNFPDLTIIVQDFPDVIEDGKERLPEQFKDRIKFMAYDFFTEQPVKDANIFFFRATFHNWPDAYCIKILKSLAPAMHSGARLIVNEFHEPEPHAALAKEERIFRARDLDMMATLASRERGGEDWVNLLKAADPRFRLKSVKMTPPNTAVGVLEIVWDG